MPHLMRQLPMVMELKVKKETPEFRYASSGVTCWLGLVSHKTSLVASAVNPGINFYSPIFNISDKIPAAVTSFPAPGPWIISG